ncbi:16S rRNA (cytosine967-C5)-methyltransferase [Actimicrobium sp. GrIS 1.19]|uniref:16S rRNA (cytosine(967)-C(5))-methyltransferase RsmB n=1 Tax=Actimicrobium sp. GrIS 1.19 TaxID=3071708 RepID=UPI002E01FD70|nr:16S rRNA (cytosine967-C5)-methyltransferase [Actimicrobium sp. GrIS 1.19]
MARTDLKPDSLAFTLRSAAHAVALVRSGTALPKALTRVQGYAETLPQARGAIQDVAYRTMRGLGRAEVLLGLLTTRAPEPAALHGLLCCALTLIDRDADEVNAPYEIFTVVNQAVEAASADPAMAHAKGMVNAVLRRFLRERPQLVAIALRQPSAEWNYPDWWIESMRSAYPQDWQAILRAGNVIPPLILRVNHRRTTPTDYLALLASQQIDAHQVGPDAIRLERAVPVLQIPGFAEGLVSVQDAAAQLAAPLLDAHDGMRVLDACAAPGGKTGHLLERADLMLTALDSDPRRLKRLEENLQRLNLSATLVAGDASNTDWWDGQLYDRILADVPCTASGILRRHPDIRWLRRKADTGQLATLSARILDNLWRLLKPNGKLLFVTCSLWPQESEAQAAAFAMRNKAERLTAPGQLMPTATTDDDHDGLFYALFRKPED